jgi:hypothetical protein
VPGRKPNIVERAGVSEDYLLTNAVVIKGTAPAAPAAKSADTPVGTSGARPAMFDVKGIDRDELKKLLGNRVQVDGTFEELEEAKPSGDSKADDSKKSEDLVDIRGTAIRLVSANCVK